MPPSSSASVPERRSRRIAPSPRRWSGFRRVRGRSAPSGSACRGSRTSRSRRSSARARAALRERGRSRSRTRWCSFARRRSRETSRGSAAWRGWGAGSSSAPAGCRASAARGGARSLRLRGEGRLPAPPGLRLVEVGDGRARRSSVALRRLPGSDRQRSRRRRGEPGGRGRRRLSPAARRRRSSWPREWPLSREAAALERIYRSYAWVSPLGPGRGAASLGDRRARGGGVAGEVGAAGGVHEGVRSDRAGRGIACGASREPGRPAVDWVSLPPGPLALLFAFAILAALTLRRDLRAARRRLAWFGARGWQLALLTAAEVGALALAGTAIGFGRRPPPAAPRVAREGRRSGGGGARAERPLGAGAGTRARGRRRRRGSRARREPSRRRPPRFSAGSPSRRSTRAALAGSAGAHPLRACAAATEAATSSCSCPGLVTFVAAVAVSRLLRPVLRAIRSASRAGARSGCGSPRSRSPGIPATRSSATCVPRRQLRPGALRGELSRDARARASATRRPTGCRSTSCLQEDLRRLIPVLDAAPLGRLRALGPGTDVDRRSCGRRAAVGRQEGESGITLLGLPPASLAKLRGWRSDFGVDEPDALGASI